MKDRNVRSPADSATALTRFTCLTNFDTIFPAPRQFMLLVLQFYYFCSVIPLSVVVVSLIETIIFFNCNSCRCGKNTGLFFVSRNQFTCLIFQGNEILYSTYSIIVLSFETIICDLPYFSCENCNKNSNSWAKKAFLVYFWFSFVTLYFFHKQVSKDVIMN